MATRGEFKNGCRVTKMKNGRVLRFAALFAATFGAYRAWGFWGFLFCCGLTVYVASIADALLGGMNGRLENKDKQ